MRYLVCHNTITTVWTICSQTQPQRDFIALELLGRKIDLRKLDSDTCIEVLYLYRGKTCSDSKQHIDGTGKQRKFVCIDNCCSCLQVDPHIPCCSAELIAILHMQWEKLDSILQ